MAEAELVDWAIFVMGVVEVVPVRVRHDGQGAEDAEGDDREDR